MPQHQDTVRARKRGAQAVLAGAAVAAAILAAPGSAAAHDTYWGHGHHAYWGLHYPHLPYHSCLESGRTDCIGVMEYVFVTDAHGNVVKVLNARRRFQPSYARSAYLADSPGPVIERRAVWEPWTDGGSVVGRPSH